MFLFTKKNKLGIARQRSEFKNKKKFQNPFFQHANKSHFRMPVFLSTWRAKLIVLEIIILFLGVGAFLLFSSVFYITHLDIEGLNRIVRKDIEDIVWRQLNDKRFFIGSQENLFLFNEKKLTAAIEESYCLEGLEIVKTMPNTITIKIQEKSNAFIWKEKDKYYYMDNEGVVIEEVNPLDIKNKNYPLIDNTEAKIEQGKINTDDCKIGYIMNIFEKFKDNGEVVIDRFILDNEKNTVKVKIAEGPQVYFNTENDIDKQIEKLFVIKNEKLKDDFNKKEYIDLRYGDRVYYR